MLYVTLTTPSTSRGILSPSFLKVSKGRAVGEIDGSIVEEVSVPKATELILKCSRRIPEVDRGHLVSYKGEECLVVEAKREGDGWSYRLKRC